MFLNPGLRCLSVVVALCCWAPGSFAQDKAGSSAPAGQGAVVARADLRACGDSRSSVGLAYLRERPSTEGVKEVDIMVRVWTGLLPSSSLFERLSRLAVVHCLDYSQNPVDLRQIF